MGFTKNIVVLYHGDCADGFSAAWAVWKKFGNRAEYIKVFHRNPPPSGLKNKEIYLVDFIYPLTTIKKLITDNKRVTAIDHHFSAEKMAKLTYEYSFSTKNSGSMLAWKYFYPAKAVPTLLKYVEDADLYKFKLPYSKEIFAYIESFDFDFKTWDKLACDLEKSAARKKCIEKGKRILKYEEKLVKRIAANNRVLVEFKGHKTYAVNSPEFPSQIGTILLKKLPPIAIIWYKSRNKIVVSLRSDGSVDVSKIAQSFNGGGHKQAAGFSFPAEEKPPWKSIAH